MLYDIKDYLAAGEIIQHGTTAISLHYHTKEMIKYRDHVGLLNE